MSARECVCDYHYTCGPCMAAATADMLRYPADSFAYNLRVSDLEALEVPRSDAQAIIDAEIATGKPWGSTIRSWQSTPGS
jgi:hypothetical protein